MNILFCYFDYLRLPTYWSSLSTTHIELFLCLTIVLMPKTLITKNLLSKSYIINIAKFIFGKLRFFSFIKLFRITIRIISKFLVDVSRTHECHLSIAVYLLNCKFSFLKFCWNASFLIFFLCNQLLSAVLLSGW